MLQTIREKMVGWVIWAVLLLVGVPFAFVGVDSFFLGGGDPVVAKVGDQKIYQSQFDAAFENRYQQLQQLMGENFRPEMFDKARFQQAVLDDMVQESMLRQYSRESGYRAGDDMVFNYISTIPAFQKDGKFDNVTYQEMLSRQGNSPQKFENQLRSSLEIDQMRAAVTETAFVSGAEAALANRLQGQERWLSYVSFEPSKYRDKVNPTAEQLQAKYDADKAAYMAPERIKLAYVELSLAGLPKADAPGTDVLKVMYDAEKDARFTTAEERKARHILVNFGEDKDASQKKVEGLAASLKTGKDFAELAAASSDDSGSKGQGGDLGWIKRGQMPEKLEAPMFALKAGEISEPIETEFGWHIVRVDEIKAQQVRAFEDASVQQELVELYQTRESQKNFQEKQEKLEQLAFENPSSLEPVAKELGLTVQTTDWFTRAGGSGIAANNAVKTAAFSAEVAQDGENSKPISTGEASVVVIRKAEYEAPRQKTLDEVREQVQTALVEEMARARAGMDADEVLKAAQGGKALADAAAEKGAEVYAPGLLKRDAAGTDRGILEALFKLPRPAAGKASFGKTVLGNGNVVVIGLSAVQEPQDATADASALAQLRDLRAGTEFNTYRKAIEAEVAVKIINPPKTEEAAPQPAE